MDKGRGMPRRSNAKAGGPGASRSETFSVKKHSAIRTGFVFEVAVFAGPEIFPAGVAVEGPAPVAEPKRKGTAFRATILDFSDEIILAGGTNQFLLKCGCGNRHENNSGDNEGKPGNEQPGERRLKQQEGVKDGSETGDDQDQNRHDEAAFFGLMLFHFRRKFLPKVFKFFQRMAAHFCVFPRKIRNADHLHLSLLINTNLKDNRGMNDDIHSRFWDMSLHNC
jgi:hypothetical protein